MMRSVPNGILKHSRGSFPHPAECHNRILHTSFCSSPFRLTECVLKIPAPSSCHSMDKIPLLRSFFKLTIQVESYILTTLSQYLRKCSENMAFRITKNGPCQAEKTEP
jgi:hypothetical protein